MKKFTRAMIAVLGLTAVWAAAADKKPPVTTSFPPKDTVVVTPAPEPTTTMAIRGRPSTSRLQNIGQSAKQLKQRAAALSASVTQSGWNDAQRASGAAPINDAVGDLTREVNALQASNGTATLDTGRRLANDLQTQLVQIGAAEDALDGARDASAATAALTQMSASLDKVNLTIDTLPPCCTEGICCHVGIQ
jgi:hypothetical protein